MSTASTQSDAEIHAYPPGTTFHDLIEKNKRNTVLLVLAMGAVTVTLFALIALTIMAYGTGVVTWQGIAIAVLAGVATVVVASLWSYYRGGKTLLRMANAKKIEHSDDPQLFNVMEELAIAGGVPLPEVYLIPSKAPNAFATGRDPEHAAVAITDGLRKKLNRDELQAVMAHELAHIRHYDIRLTMMLATLVGVIVLASHTLTRGLFFGGVRRRHRYGSRHRHGTQFGGGGRGGRGGGGVVALLMVLTIVVAILAPILAKIIKLAVSRQREYLADAGAVELTRHPKGLADALRKLGSDDTPLKQANEATQHLYIVNPVLNARHQNNVNSLMSTHPPLEERIKRIEALMR